MKCPSCGSRDIDFQEAGGQSICVSCGTVLEESTIVSSIEFQESGDRSHVIGQYVAANCSKPFMTGSRLMGRHLDNRDSRDTTLLSARRIISQVASALRLPPLFVDRANRLYQLALQRNFNVGRRQSHVVATCLYIICRQEKSPHLLIDFSDALQVNVYQLGKAFLQFTKVLAIQLPVIDPSLYIHRYADRLEFGEKMNSVILASLRIITRLKKDWIVMGRRPDGICAAALLISARAHSFHITQDTVAQLFRISNETIRKRIQEFKATPASQLSLKQLFAHELDIEYDPPAFIRNLLISSNGEVDVSIPNSETDFMNENSQQQTIILTSDLVNDKIFLDTGMQEEKLEETETDPLNSKVLNIGNTEFVVSFPSSALKKKLTTGGRHRKEEIDSLYADICSEISNIQEDGIVIGDIVEFENCLNKEETPSISSHNENCEQRNHILVKIVKDSKKDHPKGTSSTHSAKHNSEGSDVPSEVVDEGAYFFSEEEKLKRNSLFSNTYGAFMEERERKKRARDDSGAHQGSDKYTQTGKLRKKYSKRINLQSIGTASEAVIASQAIMKGASKKINYEALQGVFSRDGSFALPAIPNSGNSQTVSVGQIEVLSNNNSSKRVALLEEEEEEEEDLMYENPNITGGYYDEDDYY